MSDDGTDKPTTLAEVEDGGGAAKEGKGGNQNLAQTIDDGSDASARTPTEGLGRKEKLNDNSQEDTDDGTEQPKALAGKSEGGGVAKKAKVTTKI